MNIYHGIIPRKGGVHIIHCDRLDEFFDEFAKYRKWKSQTKNFDKDTFPFREWKKDSGNNNYWKIFYLDLDFDNTFKGKRKKAIGYFDTYEFDYSTGWDLGINISALKIKTNSLNSSNWNQQKDKIEKVLKDIWTTGKIKNTYGLDLNWPANQQSKTKNPIPKQDKDENTTDEQTNQQNQNTKNYLPWIMIGLIITGLIGITAYFIIKRKTDK